MNIKWERNSRVLSLAAQGKIKDEDVIQRTATDEFPPEMATVRMQKLSDKVPHVVVHIRGKAKQRAYWSGGTYVCAKTCRVNVANSYDNCMSSNGELDEDLTWLDVHNIITKVRETLGL